MRPSGDEDVYFLDFCQPETHVGLFHGGGHYTYAWSRLLPNEIHRFQQTNSGLNKVRDILVAAPKEDLSDRGPKKEARFMAHFVGLF